MGTQFLGRPLAGGSDHSVAGDSRTKGQAALEYFAIISLALLLATPLILQSQRALSDVETTSKSARITRGMSAMAEGASLVYSQGSPAKVSFTVNLPAGIVDSNVTDDYLYYKIQTPRGNTTFFEQLDFQVRGTIPETSGTYLIVTKAETDYVNITYQ